MQKPEIAFEKFMEFVTRPTGAFEPYLLVEHLSTPMLSLLVKNERYFETLGENDRALIEWAAEELATRSC